MEVTAEEGAAKACIDEDYIADVTTTQGTWDPWPTSAQDDPTPPQDDPAPAKDH